MRSMTMKLNRFDSFWQTMSVTKDSIMKDHLSIVAAGLSYFILFAFVPALGSILLLYALFSDPAQVSQQITSFASQLPAEVQSIIQEQINQFMSQKQQLRIGALISLLLTFWGASKGTKALMEGLNMIYGREEKRGFIKLNLMALFITISGTVMSAISVAVIIVLPNILEFLPLPDMANNLLPFISWIVLLLTFTGFLSLCYAYGPSRTKRDWGSIFFAASLACIFWAITSFLFTFYVSQFGDFKAYGTMSAVIVLMFWFYISSFIVLLGAEISVAFEKKMKALD